MTKRVIRIALLICDTPLKPVLDEFGDYLQIYRTWLEQSLATYPDKSLAANTELILDGYDVVDKREYPARERLIAGSRDGYNAIMLTGSKHTAHDPSETFVPPLVDFVRSTITDPATQHLQVLGICFGHQIVSMALGGTCVPGTNGWEIGVYGMDLTDEGRYWWCGDVAGQGGNERVYVEQMHRDHVPSVPPSCTLLGSTSSYPVHSFVKFHPSSTPTNPLAHVLCLQGHPEFTPGIVKHMVDVRAESGVFNSEVATEARRRLGGKDGSGGEGLGKVGWACWRVLMQDLPLVAQSPTMERNGDGDIVMGEQMANGTAEGSGGGLLVNGHSSSNGEPSKRVRDYLADEKRYEAIDRVLDRSGPWTDEQFVGGSEAKSFLREKAKILVIGAGGLGCEILQNLALTGFTDIHVIDMDTIDISNLNRQFLFRESDVGKSKALVAAEFVMSRVPGVKVTPYHGKIQDHPPDFYMQFAIVIAGLDSISARRWINATLVNMVDEENEDSLKPLIDGGTEGFKGQARVILPTISSCYECSIDMLTPPTVFPVCTIANTPRLPEHCIEWASVLEWPKVFKDKKLDTDDPDHIEWLYQKASARAAQFKIDGVTWTLTQGVVKNIIPAIASTNAIIAASCCNEAFKIATTCAPSLNNYMMYTGNSSIYTYTFEHGKRDECPVCGGEAAVVQVGKDWTVERLVEHLQEAQEFKLSRPSLSSESGPLFWHDPPGIFEATKVNLDKLVSELVSPGSILSVTDKALPAANLSLEIKYE